MEPYQFPMMADRCHFFGQQIPRQPTARFFPYLLDWAVCGFIILLVQLSIQTTERLPNKVSKENTRKEQTKPQQMWGKEEVERKKED